MAAVQRQCVEQQQQILAQQLVIILGRYGVPQRKGNRVILAVKFQADKGKPYPLSRTFLREREKQQFLPEPLLLSFY